AAATPPAAPTAAPGAGAGAGAPRRDGARSPEGARIYRDRVEPHWLPDGNRFWYTLALPGDRREFVLVEAAEGKRGPAFDRERAAKALEKAAGHPFDPEKLPFEALEWAADGKRLRLLGKDSFDLALETYEASAV